ncbi:hypothetical protein MHI37_23550 [Paenibacillus sp. FSL H8-0548]|nr:hypothetical protein [Paenibacillus sp. FSL H8-0548]
MTKQNDRVTEQAEQAAKNSQKSNEKQPESAGFDKKLDGPNRPSI